MSILTHMSARRMISILIFMLGVHIEVSSTLDQIKIHSRKHIDRILAKFGTPSRGSLGLHFPMVAWEGFSISHKESKLQAFPISHFPFPPEHYLTTCDMVKCVAIFPRAISHCYSCQYLGIWHTVSA